MSVLKRTWIIIGFCLAAGFVTSAQAQTTYERAVKDHTLRLGFSSDKPWIYRNSSGALEGIETDIFQSILDPLGIKDLTLVNTEFNALIPGLQANRIDVSTGGLYITPQRCQLVAFSNPYLKIADGLVVRAGNPHNIHSYKDFVNNPQLRLGTVRGSVTAQNAEDAGVPVSRQLLLPDSPSVVSALLGDRIDAASFSLGLTIALVQDPNVKGLERAVPFTGYVDSSGHERLGFAAFAFRTDDRDLKDAFDKGLARMLSDGSLAAILKKYGFSDAELPVGATAQELCKG